MLKINNSQINELALKQSSNEKVAGSAEKTSVGKTREEAKNLQAKNLLHISKEAELLEKAQKLMKNSDDIDMEKVKKFKDLLRNNEYQIDNNLLAGKLSDILQGRGVL